MYEVVFDGDVFTVQTLEEVEFYYRKAKNEEVCIEVYKLETKELIVFWCPDPDS